MSFLLLLCLGAVAFTQSLTDAQKIDQAIALVKSVQGLTDTGLTNQKNILTRLETLKGQFVVVEPTPEPVPPPPPPVYVTQSVFDALEARVAKLEAGTPAPTPEPTPEPTPTPTPEPTPTPDPIVLPPITGSHGYYDALCASSAAFKCHSFRDAAQLSPSVAPWLSYSPTTDTDPQRQDALKVRIPVWHPLKTASLAADITPTQTVFDIANRATMNFENGISLLIDGEIMTQTARTNDTVTVTRGQFGTTATAHAAGTPIQRNTNSLPVQHRADIQTDGSVSATYLLTWDGYWTDSYVGAGLHNHKSQQIASWKDGNQWVEMQTVFSGPPSCCPNPEWTAQDVAAGEFRWYGQSFTNGFVQNPGQPMASPPWIIKPNTWTRFWVLVEANAETDHSKFQNVTTVTAAVPVDATTITVAHDFGNPYSPLTSPVGVAEKVGVSPGRAIRIGSEVMTVVSGDATGTVRNLIVKRGQQGTTATAHASGAAVQAIDDFVTIWVADALNAPRKLYDRVSLFLPIDAAEPTQRGAIGKFWLEFNTSQQQLPAGRIVNGQPRDLVAYIKNLAVLKDPGDVSGLLVRDALSAK